MENTLAAPKLKLPKSVLWKIILPVPIALLASVVALTFWLPSSMQKNVEKAAVVSATKTVNQFKTVRGYYTRNVIKKIVTTKALKPSFNHKTEPGSVPLPATMIHDLGALLSQSGTNMSLFSAFPFPNRKDRALDGFQKEAWDAISADPSKPFVRQETIDGKTVVRVGVADKMVAQGCVNCHNTRADTPKNDWKLGDVRGILEISTVIDDQIAAGNQLSYKIAIGVAIVSVIIIALLVFVCLGSVGRPLKSLQSVMTKLSEGEKDTEIPFSDKSDEIGDMARTVEVFKHNLIENERLQEEQKRNEARAREEEQQRQQQERDAERAETEKRERDSDAATERSKRMEQIIAGFESEISTVVSTVSSAATEMQSSAETMSASADQTSQQAVAVAAAAEEASTNVQTVASAAEELSASVEEISRQVGKSNEIAQNAVDEAKLTNEKVEGLAESAQKIGEVVNLINDIASQTNLLALNATIEAARAGDAGKGFAVVASEVKSLATQTSKATEEIGAQIAAIQAATSEAVQAIQGIGGTIGELGEIATSVSQAVDQQGSATREIAGSVQQAASGTQEVSSNITQVTQAASESQSASSQMLDAAKELAQQGGVLQQEVDKFLADIRAA